MMKILAAGPARPWLSDPARRREAADPFVHDAVTGRALGRSGDGLVM
jgi:hypothetical protein